MSALENLNVLPFVNTRLKNGYTRKAIVEELRIAFPCMKLIKSYAFCYAPKLCHHEVVVVLLLVSVGFSGCYIL